MTVYMITKFQPTHDIIRIYVIKCNINKSDLLSPILILDFTRVMYGYDIANIQVF